MLPRPILAAAALYALSFSPALAQDVPPPAPEPEPEPGQLELLVVDEDGEGIFGASVHLVLTEEERAQKLAESPTGHSFALDTVKTDPDGFVTIEVPPGQRRAISVSKWSVTNHVTLDVEPLEPGEARELTVEMKTKPDLDVTGQVVDGATGTPLASVQVFVSESPGDTFGGRAQPLEIQGEPNAITDSAGAFSVRVKSWQAGRVTLHQPGRTPIITCLVAEGAPKQRSAPFAMRQGAALEGRVSSQAGDVPRGAAVVLEAQGYHFHATGEGASFIGSDVLYRTAVDAEGRFSFRDLPSEIPMSLRVEVGRDVLLREPQPRTLDADSSVDIALVLGAGATLSGVAVDPAGAPLSGAAVWLRAGSRAGLMDAYPKPDETTITDTEGRYRFDDVAPGEWVVGLAPLDRRTKLSDMERYAPLSYAVQVGGEAVLQGLTVHRGLYVEGSVAAPTGYAMPQSTSVMASCDGLWIGNVDVKDGRFRIGPMVPGEWSVTVSCWGRAGDDRLLAPSSPVLVEPALLGSGADPIQLVLQEGCGFSAFAVDPDSNARVPVQYRLFGDATSARQLSMQERDGVEAWNLKPDTYRLVLQAGDGRIASHTFTLGAGDLETEMLLELAPGGFVDVRYEGPSEYGQIELIQNGIPVHFTSLKAGSTERLHGAVGSATVHVSNSRGQKDAPQFEEVREVQIQAGEVKTVHVEVHSRADDAAQPVTDK